MSWRYKVLECVGQGSSGKVYRARYRLSGQIVALKQLAVSDVHNARHEDRLRREVAALAMLDHDNIVRLHGVDNSSERTALAMEFVDGATVHELLSYGPLSIDASLYIIRSLLQALSYAHSRGLVHRDVSPRNVLISWDGDVKLADFGIAKLVGSTRTAGRPAGTVPYIAPEQIQGSDVDGRADLFAVGCLLYALIAGQSPFRANTVHEMEGRIVSAELAVSQHMPERLTSIVERLLSRQRDARYATADELLAALPMTDHGRERLVELIDVRVTRPAPPRRAVIWVLASVAVGLVFGVASVRILGGGTVESQVEQKTTVDAAPNTLFTEISSKETASMSEADRPGPKESVEHAESKSVAVEDAQELSSSVKQKRPVTQRVTTDNASEDDTAGSGQSVVSNQGKGRRFISGSAGKLPRKYISESANRIRQ